MLRITPPAPATLPGRPWRARGLVAACLSPLLFLAACSGDSFQASLGSGLDRGIIQGFVRDLDAPDTPVLEGVKVVLTPFQQETFTQTGGANAGFYEFRNVIPGFYEVTAIRPGETQNHTSANARIEGGDVFQANLNFGFGEGTRSSEQVLYLSSNNPGAVFFTSERGTDTSFLSLSAVSPPLVHVRFNRASAGELVVEAAPGGNSGIFLTDPSTGFFDTVIQTAAPETHPDLSPDGSRVVYAADTDGNGNFEIWLIQRDGSAPTLLVDDEDPVNGFSFDNRDPAWSPDGVTIAFVARRVDATATIDQRDYELATVRAEGGPIFTLSQDLFDDRDPAWHPDSTTLYFAKQAGGFFQLYVTTAQQGTAEVRLTNNFVDDRDPTVSFDGVFLAWTTRSNLGGGNPESNQELALARILGTSLQGPRVLTQTPGAVTISNPDFRPSIPENPQATNVVATPIPAPTPDPPLPTPAPSDPNP